MATLPFGKHMGEDIEDVPTAYLEWFLTGVDAPPVGDKRRSAFLDLLSEIESELVSRKKYGDRR
jgi:uncharacterized protein (DUF3820 family)